MPIFCESPGVPNDDATAPTATTTRYNVTTSAVPTDQTFTGSSDHDYLIGTVVADAINPDAGADLVRAAAGNHTINLVADGIWASKFGVAKKWGIAISGCTHYSASMCRRIGVSISVQNVEIRMKMSNWGPSMVSIFLGLLRRVALAFLFVGAVGPALADTPPVFEPPPAPGAVSYDGIYQWSPGNFLSLHQDGTQMIATIYFTNDGSYSFPAPAGGGVLPVPQLDLFDLMGGPVTGSTATIDGTRFHRACNVGYDFTFNNDATITVTRIGVSNTPAADLAHISCSSIVGIEAATMSVPKIRFNQ